MPTPQQTEILIATLIADYAPDELADRNARASHVPRHYRSPELEALEPWQRAIVFAEARKRVRKRPAMIAMLFGWIALCTLVWQFGFGGRTSEGVAAGYILITLLPQVLFINVATQREIRSLAQLARRRIAEAPRRAGA